MKFFRTAILCKTYGRLLLSETPVPEAYLEPCQQSHSETVAQRCSVRKVFLEISQNSQLKQTISLQIFKRLWAYNFIKKETLTQVFSCEFFEISMNTFLTEQLWWLLLLIKKFWKIPIKISLVKSFFIKIVGSRLGLQQYVDRCSMENFSKF